MNIEYENKVLLKDFIYDALLEKRKTKVNLIMINGISKFRILDKYETYEFVLSIIIKDFPYLNDFLLYKTDERKIVIAKNSINRIIQEFLKIYFCKTME